MNENKVLTFHEAPKSHFVELAKYHGEMNNGCRVGCMFPNRHKDGYEVAGVCPQLLYLVDKYFEKQELKAAADWHVWFWENMPEGVDSWDIFSDFMSQMLISPECGVYGKSDVSDKHLNIVSKLYKNRGTKEDFVAATAACAYAAAAGGTYAYAATATAATAATAAYAAVYAAPAAADAAYAADAAAADAYAAQLTLLKSVILSYSNNN